MKPLPFHNSPVLKNQYPIWRGRVVLLLLGASFLALAIRALYLQGVTTDFLVSQGVSRYERTLVLHASRGKILDRNGVVLAASIPARSIWADPDDAASASPAKLKELAQLLDMPQAELRKKLSNEEKNKTFVYLKRQVPLDVAQKINEMRIPGVHQIPDTRRFYPEGEVLANIVGFNDVEDKGQEGVELAFNEQLYGRAGSRRVMRDRLGRIIDDVRAVNLPVDGKDITLAVDTRIQYQVYRALQEAMTVNKAKGAAAVVIDVQTGEILALGNMPTYDPNKRDSFRGGNLRNQALTDTFEPGSIMKPFTVALALDLKRINTNTLFNTGGGKFSYQGATITDVSKNGTLDAAGVLLKSSNIGMTLISEKLEAREMWGRFSELGFGQAPQTGFPGAAAGRLRPWERWRLIEKATMSYGYGLSVSLLQMARAYTVFARNGDLVSLSLLKRENEPTSTKVYPPDVAQKIRLMLEAAAGPDGAKAAQVQGYRVAGKSGTARKIVDGRYSTSRYRGSFVGFAPVSNPRVVVAVTIDEPQGGVYYGGKVAAPVFAQIVGSTLRIMGVQPDAPFESSIISAGVTR
ncbi:penicillin-binding protein 2 [Orrella sp. NBD-18]|uniref:Peptidoglycan D,D-transpeptidase FtsI n=1 Tax=Sheuella amnicola TaxID=2707330 RepID=A0A6B2R6E4_9BURK|nr:penicillin-binding protein 2 [Sheuella amnicola]NDY82895.1 penicillin-binding protein 2 [Sheuella amnicola]HBI84257.1 cell division protein [Alcaligenaceae bacterium]